MKNRLVVLILFIIYVVSTLTVGICESKTTTPIIQTVTPYLDACIDYEDFDNIENYELNSSWDGWDSNTCILQFNISEGYKCFGINDLYNGRFKLYINTPNEEREYGQFFNEEMMEIFFRMIPYFPEIQEKLPSDIKLEYLLILGDEDFCIINSENIDNFL